MAEEVAENLTKLQSVAEKAEDLSWRETCGAKAKAEKGEDLTWRDAERGGGRGGGSNLERL